MLQIAVIGLGRFGYKVASTLSGMGVEVIAIDTDEVIVESIKDRVQQSATADATDEKALRALGISDVDTAIIGIGEHMEESILCTVVLRRLGVGKIIARAISPLHGQVLHEIGASKVIQIEEQMGEQIAKSIVAANVFEHITFPAGYSIVEMHTPEEFAGKSLKELELRQRYGVLCVALQRRVPAIDAHGRSRHETKVHLMPEPADVIHKNDIIVLVGTEASIEKIVEL